MEDIKGLEELTAGESAWQFIEELMGTATNEYKVLPKDKGRAEQELIQLQQGIGFTVGAIVYETGGILIDNSWIRIIGSGSDDMTRTLSDWNYGRSYDKGEVPGFVMIGDDALGGIFAINNNELGDDQNNMYYLAPDTVVWEPLEISFEGFLNFCLHGNLEDFYTDQRWDSWKEDTADITADQAFFIVPPLWAEGPDNIAEREIKVVSMDEAFELSLEANHQLYIDEQDDDDDDDDYDDNDDDDNDDDDNDDDDNDDDDSDDDDDSNDDDDDNGCCGGHHHDDDHECDCDDDDHECGCGDDHKHGDGDEDHECCGGHGHDKEGGCGRK